MIPLDVLLGNGGTLRVFQKNKPIFFEGQQPAYYYQVVEGSVRMVNVNEDGKEFIQGIFKEGQSFGEPVLFIDEPYPASAIANEHCVIIKVSKQDFLSILREQHDIHLAFTVVLAKRLFDKSLIAKEISSYSPEHRINTVLQMFKKRQGENKGKYKVEFSRQQIADMTGLRVETVIRSIKKLEDKGMIMIQKGKIFI